jgi:hypothetical protein
MSTPRNPPVDDYTAELSYNQLEHFRRHYLNPPANLYVTVDDIILVRGWAGFSASTVQISLRILAPDGSIQTAFYPFTVVANGATPTLLRIANLEGFLLSASAQVLNTARGLVFLSMVLQRGVGSSDATFGQVLLQGYPDTFSILGYPQQPPQSSLDGRGFPGIEGGAGPIAGAEVSITVPAGQNWIFKSLCVPFTTSATVANRFPTLHIDLGGNPGVVIPVVAAITAGTAATLTWGATLNPLSTNNVQTMATPEELRLGPGTIIHTVTSGLQAADQYGNTGLMVEIFLAP